MAKKNSWRDSKLGFVAKNLLAGVVVVILAIIALVIGLRSYTEHGKEKTVPDITSLYLEEAKIVLEADGLRLEVIDSTYSKKAPLGTIVEQNPRANAKVKNGRTVYVIQNAKMRRPVILPELHDVSLRQAQTSLRAMGIEVDSIVYEPSTYRDIVLDVRMGDSILMAGNRLEEGSRVVLIVGMGQGTAEVEIPAVIGKSLEEARAWLLSHRLTLGVVEYDVPPTEETEVMYVVYSQTPESGTIVLEGSHVDLKLSVDLEKTVTADNQQDEEEFW